MRCSNPWLIKEENTSGIAEETFILKYLAKKANEFCVARTQ